MIKFVYGGINTHHEKGEYCKKLTFPHYSFFYFLTPFSYHTENGLTNADKGSIVINAPFSTVYHGPQKDMEEGFINDWFYAKGDEIDKLLTKFKLPINQAFPISSPSLVKDSMIAIQQELHKKQDGFEDKIDLIIENFIIDLYRSFINATPDNSDKRINFAHNKISQNLEKNWTLEEIARLSGYSVSRFSELYQKKYGLSPKASLLNMRLQNATRLLLYTPLSIEEIAIKCGFGSIYHFSKFFKSKIGVSPSDFRNA